MAEETRISWAHHTFNPWLGCVKVSDGCKHCYAEHIVANLMHRDVWGPASTHRRERTSSANWHKVTVWNQKAQYSGTAARVFCASLADIFEDHPDCNASRPDLWDLVKRTPYLHWLILTKRPENIRRMLPESWGPDGWPNVWLGTSIEDMRVAARADHLRDIPAVVRFVSYEPALGPLDGLDLSYIDWVIAGGESGPDYRPMKVEWMRAMRDRCREEGRAFFFKQSADRRPERGIKLDGEVVRNYPQPHSVLWEANRLDPYVRRAYGALWAQDYNQSHMSVSHNATKAVRA